MNVFDNIKEDDMGGGDAPYELDRVGRVKHSRKRRKDLQPWVHHWKTSSMDMSHR